MSDDKLGWKRIWVICYRARNGNWYPATHVFFPQRNLAEDARKEYSTEISKGYKVFPYQAGKGNNKR